MRHLLSFIFSLFAISAAAQNISGVVKDTRGNLLPGVSISLKDSYDGATTDSSGTFSFKTAEACSNIVCSKLLTNKEANAKAQVI